MLSRICLLGFLMMSLVSCNSDETSAPAFSGCISLSDIVPVKNQQWIKSASGTSVKDMVKVSILSENNWKERVVTMKGISPVSIIDKYYKYDGDKVVQYKEETLDKSNPGNIISSSTDEKTIFTNAKFPFIRDDEVGDEKCRKLSVKTTGGRKIQLEGVTTRRDFAGDVIVKTCYFKNLGVEPGCKLYINTKTSSLEKGSISGAIEGLYYK